MLNKSILGSSYLDFKPQLYIFPRLLPNYRIISIDPVGFGKSIPPERSFDFNMFENDVEILKALMDELKITKFSILGHSGGATVGVKFAVLYPEKIEKLIIVASFTFGTQEEVNAANSFKDPEAWSEAMSKPLFDFYGRDYVKRMWGEFVGGMQEYIDVKSGDYILQELKFIKAETLVILGWF